MQLPLPLKVGGASGGLLIFGLLFGWVLFPMILKSQIAKVSLQDLNIGLFLYWIRRESQKLKICSQLQIRTVF